MKIAQYSIGMNSQHTYARTVSQTERLRARVGDQRPDFEGMNASDRPVGGAARVAISDAARQAVAAASADRPDTADAATDTSQADAIGATGDGAAHDPKLGLIIKVIEALTGKKIKLMDPSQLGKLSSADDALARAELNKAANQASSQPTQQG